MCRETEAYWRSVACRRRQTLSSLTQRTRQRVVEQREGIKKQRDKRRESKGREIRRGSVSANIYSESAHEKCEKVTRKLLHSAQVDMVKKQAAAATVGTDCLLQ